MAVGQNSGTLVDPGSSEQICLLGMSTSHGLLGFRCHDETSHMFFLCVPFGLLVAGLLILVVMPVLLVAMPLLVVMFLFASGPKGVSMAFSSFSLGFVPRSCEAGGLGELDDIALPVHFAESLALEGFSPQLCGYRLQPLGMTPYDAVWVKVGKIMDS